MGGEKYSRPSYSRISMGSPPRGRGKVLVGVLEGGEQGITPAWAGKRGKDTLPSIWTKDHPRVGGEKQRMCGLICRERGSPPRGRGKVLGIVQSSFLRRITPAWAGKSPWGQAGQGRCGDHPRVGGEKVSTPWAWRNTGGSPPRGRGKGPQGVPDAQGNGITPAWAGKRCQCGPPPW